MELCKLFLRNLCVGIYGAWYKKEIDPLLYCILQEFRELWNQDIVIFGYLVFLIKKRINLENFMETKYDFWTFGTCDIEKEFFFLLREYDFLLWQELCVA